MKSLIVNPQSNPNLEQIADQILLRLNLILNKYKHHKSSRYPLTTGKFSLYCKYINNTKIMIKEKLISAINAQICQELTASYSYLGMSTYFDELSLDGFSSWMQNQHSEEHEHAMKLLNYLQDRGGRVQLASIPSPKIEFNSILEVFEISLQMEIENTNSINKLYELALEQNDHATKSHLQWFLDEQVEEEKSMEDVIANLKLIGDDKAGLLYLNDKLGNRSSESE